MSAEMARKVIESLDKNIREYDLGAPFFSDQNYRAFPLEKENFEPINLTASDRNIAFVDGGNQEVLGAPNFSVQINRVYFNIFKGRERIQKSLLPTRIEFFSTTHSSFRNNEVFYDTSIFPLREEFRKLLPNETHLSFNSFDRTITIGTMRADISRVASIARRFAEWAYATHVVERELEEGDVIVLDGTLQTAFTNEAIYSNKLYETSKSKNVIVTGLSKTSGLFTNTGMSLLGAVSKLAEDSKVPHPLWYLPIAEVTSTDHNAVILVIKLNSKSEHIFRYEIYREQFVKLNDNELNEILSQLAENSQDVSFPGYPYGLVDADRFARVATGEVENYKVLLLSEISKRGKWNKFARHIRAFDAHTILNMLIG